METETVAIAELNSALTARHSAPEGVVMTDWWLHYRTVVTRVTIITEHEGVIVLTSGTGDKLFEAILSAWIVNCGLRKEMTPLRNRKPV